MAREASNKIRRTPVQDRIRSRLAVQGKDPDYEYRFFNDVDNRIELAKEAGWEMVEVGTHSVGERRVAQATPEGSLQTVSVGNGVIAYLMRIKREWYTEDQQVKQRRVDELENSTKADPNQPGFYGRIGIERR